MTQSISDINSEIAELDDHKSRIETTINHLAESAEENAHSAEITGTNMQNFKKIADDNERETERIISVSQKLVEYAKQVEQKESALIEKKQSDVVS